MREYIQETINTYNEMASRYRGRRSAFDMSQWIDMLLSLMPGKEILEIGCGPGRDAKLFLARECKYVGIDLSEKLLEIAKEEVPDAQFQHADMLELPFEDDSFDGIWNCATFHHLKTEDMPIAMGEMARVLRKGGVLFLGTKLGDSEEYLKDGEFDGKERYFNYIKPEFMQELLENARFELVESEVNVSGEKFPGLCYRPQQKYINLFARKK